MSTDSEKFKELLKTFKYENKWNEIIDLTIKENLQQNYFQIFRVEALFNLEKNQEAINILQKIVTERYDIELHPSLFQMLEKVANSDDSEAQYTLACYYFVRKLNFN
jgi:hypothetical protein